MDEKKQFELLVALTEYEADVATDFADSRMQTLEEFLVEAAEERARQVAYSSDWDDEFLSQEELDEFTNNYADDELVDFLRDARRYE